MTTPVQILPAPAAPAAPATAAADGAPVGGPFAAALAEAGASTVAADVPGSDGATVPATPAAPATPVTPSATPATAARPAPDVLTLLRATLGQLGAAREVGTADLAADASALLRAALGPVDDAGESLPAGDGALAEVPADGTSPNADGEELSRTLGALLAAVRPPVPGPPVQRDGGPVDGHAVLAAAADTAPAGAVVAPTTDGPATAEASTPVDETAPHAPTTTTTDTSRPAPAASDVTTAGDHGPAGTAATGTDATSQPRVTDRVAGPVGDPSPPSSASPPRSAAEPGVVDAPPVESAPTEAPTAPEAATTRVRPDLADAPRPVQVDPAAAPDVVAAPQVDDLTGVTTARTPMARSDTGLAAQVAARVEAAVQALENAPPPRDVTLEIEGMRLLVRLRGDVVRVSGDIGLPAGWDGDLRSSLASRGFQLGHDGGDGHPGDERGGGSDQHASPLPAPEGSPAHTRSARSDRADDLRM